MGIQIPRTQIAIKEAAQVRHLRQHSLLPPQIQAREPMVLVSRRPVRSKITTTTAQRRQPQRRRRNHSDLKATNKKGFKPTLETFFYRADFFSHIVLDQIVRWHLGYVGCLVIHRRKSSSNDSVKPHKYPHPPMHRRGRW